MIHQFQQHFVVQICGVLLSKFADDYQKQAVEWRRLVVFGLGKCEGGFVFIKLLGVLFIFFLALRIEVEEKGWGVFDIDCLMAD